jgi:TPR repeat protein
MMGDYYFYIEKNYPLAIEKLTKAMDFGFIKAIDILAYYYRYIARDFQKAKECLLKASDLGSRDARVELGHLYQYALFDKENAVEYYKLALIGHDPKEKNLNAMFHLGKLYETEEQDYDLMKFYYNMAIDQDIDKEDTKGSAIQMTCIEHLMNHYKNVREDKEAVTRLMDKLKQTAVATYPTINDPYINKFFTSFLEKRYM